jgi:HEPN domain-containing protein
MSEPSKAEILLQVAKRDLETLAGMLNVNVFADEPFGFFVQQAAEKLLKSWLAILGETYPYTHNLSILLQSLEELGCDISLYWSLTDFIPFAVEFRYELLIDDEPIDRNAAIAQIQNLYSHVESILQSSATGEALNE